MLNTETVNVHDAVLPDVSVAVQVTVVVPTGNIEPDAGVQLVVTPGQLSLAVGAAYVAVTAVVTGHVTAATAVTLAGQLIDGGCVSFTVTVNEQLGPAVVEHVTVVVPFGNVEPEAGEHAV